MRPEPMGGRKAFTLALAAGVSTLALGACVPAVQMEEPAEGYQTCEAVGCGDNVAIEVE